MSQDLIIHAPCVEVPVLNFGTSKSQPHHVTLTLTAQPASHMLAGSLKGLHPIGCISALQSAPFCSQLATLAACLPNEI